ncbi:MAG: Transcriptional regulator PadR-like family [Alphaproteobacteria bacterium]|nr:Transcriptional regulator PadR-like family [Alphaproteobacteria bacterium]
MNLISLFQTAPTSIGISAREIAVLECIRALGNRGGCCADLQEQILQHTGKEPRIATLYALLTELDRKGLVEPFESIQHEKGGRPRQVYRLTEAGRQAIALGVAMAQSHAHLIPA